MRCQRCSHELSSGADRCLRCFALNPQNVAGPLFAGLDSDPPKDLRVRFDDDPTPGEQPALPEKTPLPPPKPRKAARAPPPSLPLVEIAQTPAPKLPLVEIVHTPAPPVEPVPAERPVARRLPLRTFLLAWAIDFGLVGTITLLHAALAAAVLGPERLAPGPAGSLDYWLDLFRGGGVSFLWILLIATLGLAYCAFSALLLGRTPGLALATVSRLPRERSAP